jgi:hypothetical protein
MIYKTLTSQKTNDPTLLIPGVNSGAPEGK